MGLEQRPGIGVNVPTTLLRQVIQPVRQQDRTSLGARNRLVKTQGSTESINNGGRRNHEEDVVNSGHEAQARVAPRGDSGRQIRAGKHLKGLVGQVTVPNKLAL